MWLTNTIWQPAKQFSALATAVLMNILDELYWLSKPQMKPGPDERGPASEPLVWMAVILILALVALSFVVRPLL